MPLGSLISVEEQYREDIARSMQEASDDQIYAELFDIRNGTEQAVDTGRGHMYLMSYLLEHGELDNVLFGETSVKSYFGDEMTITVNSAVQVKSISERLESIGGSELDDFAKSYHAQIPLTRQRHVEVKRGFFARIIGAPDTKIVTEDVDIADVTADESLHALFNEVKSFYAAASKRGAAVFLKVLT